MNATNFSPDMLPKLNNVLKFVLENPHSDFYRKKYGEKPDFYPVKSYEDFQKIPLLTKNEILSVDWKKRLFIKEAHIERFAVSSGTTDINMPMVLPRAEKCNPDEISNAKIDALKIRRIMHILKATNAMISDITMDDKKTYTPISGDVDNLKLTATLIKNLDVDGIHTFPTILDLLIKELEKISFDFRKIRWISLMGEYCSNSRKEYYQNIFRDAFLNFKFGSSETGPSGYQCKNLSKGNPNVFHPHLNHLKEIIGDDGKVLRLSEVGNMIHTDLKGNRAFPLIRYDTSDMGIIDINASDECGNDFFFAIEGRKESDLVRLGGSSINTSSIEKSLAPLKNYIEHGFQAHIHEIRQTDGSLKPQIILELVLKERYSDMSKDDFFTESMRHDVSKRFRMTMKSNLQELVEKDVFLPLEIKFVKRLKSCGIKNRSIISHLQ